jgi:hypothetical protein
VTQAPGEPKPPGHLGAIPYHTPVNRLLNLVQLHTGTFHTPAYARASVWESWRNPRFGRAGLLADAMVAGQRSVGGETRGSRLVPGRSKLGRQVDGHAKVHLIRRLAREGRMWHLGVVLLDVLCRAPDYAEQVDHSRRGG